MSNVPTLWCHFSFSFPDKMKKAVLMEQAKPSQVYNFACYNEVSVKVSLEIHFHQDHRDNSNIVINSYSLGGMVEMCTSQSLLSHWYCKLEMNMSYEKHYSSSVLYKHRDIQLGIFATSPFADKRQLSPMILYCSGLDKTPRGICKWYIPLIKCGFGASWW